MLDIHLAFLNSKETKVHYFFNSEILSYKNDHLREWIFYLASLFLRCKIRVLWVFTRFDN